LALNPLTTRDGSASGPKVATGKGDRGAGPAGGHPMVATTMRSEVAQLERLREVLEDPRA
jgi:hypothetical protein